jgi:N6-adenosine-specific RNA methylase IME4
MENKLIINEELKKLIPPLTESEYKLLEESLINEGCRDKLITWNDTIVDGHNRYELCTKHGIPFQTEDRDFEDIEEVKVWMIDNQKGRRNLTDGWKWELAQTRKAILAEKGKEKYAQTVGRPANNSLSIVDNDKHNTREQLASELGWSTGKVAMADVVWKKAEPEVKEKIKTGETSINQVYQDIKKEEKKKEIEQKKQDYNNRINENTSSVSTDIYTTNKKYRVIYADPAWSYNDKQQTDKLGGAIKHYNTMTTSEICNLPINYISEKNAVLFLWVTSPLLPDGMQVMQEWGFKYKSMFIWDKVKHNMGHYNSVRHELLLIGTKGSCVPDNKKLYDSVQAIEKTEKHSQKPKEFIEIIDDLYQFGNRIELFAREKHGENWQYWGNEV